MPSWPFELEWEVFNGMEIISSSHVDVEDEILDPYCGIGCAVVRFNVDRLEPLGEFVIKYFICEAERVCGASISGRVVA